MNAPAPGRLAQFLDRVDLAAHAAGAAAAAGNKSGLGELGGRTAGVRTALVFARHVTSPPTRADRGPASNAQAGIIGSNRPEAQQPTRAIPRRLAAAIVLS